MRVLVAGSLVLALTAMPAFANEKQKEDRVVCKRAESFNTGSHLSRPKKTCMKASEWKMMEDETDRTMRRAQDSGSANPSVPAPVGGGPS